MPCNAIHMHCYKHPLLLLQCCSEEDVSSTMLNNVTGDLQRAWVTRKNSKTMAVWCGGYDGFVCLWCLKSAHKHWHRNLRWTLPHKCRLAHATLTSSSGYSLFHPLLHLSASSHTNVQAIGCISTHTGGGGCWWWRESHVEFIKQFECDYANELCLIHARVWTSGVHADCDKLHSLTAGHVCSECLWLLICFKSMKAAPFIFLTHAAES